MSDLSQESLQVTNDDRREVVRRSRRRRLEAIGLLVFVLGLAGAGLTYWLETRNAGPTTEELLPGSTARNEREMGILYGQTYAMIFGWLEELQEPRGHAALIVLGSALVAGVCRRVARLPDPDDKVV